MLLTVAICTWNRARLLDQTLSRMRDLRLPEGVNWELLVINNNCTDDTDAVIARQAEGLPLRRLFEAPSGKSFALNRAASEARGEFVIWTDDDVLVASGWLAEYAAAIRRWPTASFFGGPSEPWFDASPPLWFRRVWSQVGGVYALVDFGTEPVRFDPKRVPYGLNMAVRNTVQKKYQYDSRLGPRPNSSIRGEETSLIRRMIADGHEGWYVPGARVQHFIPAERQTTQYVREWFAGHGQVLAQDREMVPEVNLLGRPRWLWRKLIASELRYRWGRVFARPEKWIEDLKDCGLYRGFWRATAPKAKLSTTAIAVRA